MPRIQLDKKALLKGIESAKRRMFHIETGDNLAILKSLNPNQFDSMVTDPPAGISFMGKEWDGDKGSRDAWIRWLAETMAEAMRVLKPGAHALVWAIPRTQHWTMMALENAGFEVRDVVYHMYGQGFPKSQDISKAIDKAAGVEREVVGFDPVAAKRTTAIGTAAYGDYKGQSGDVTAPATPDTQKWSGWGTALKPACEPWILVQKPLSENTIAANVLKHGTGGLNIDGTRIGDGHDRTTGGLRGENMESDHFGQIKFAQAERPTGGRFPANVIFDEDAAKVLDEQTKDSRAGKPTGGGQLGMVDGSDGKSIFGNKAIRTSNYDDGNVSGASRFFYTAKASKSDRGEGNVHPTVKPIKLMKYLIKLITPPGGTVLDPFMGSGTTGVAAIKSGFKFYGIDQDKQYSGIALKRLENVYSVKLL